MAAPPEFESRGFPSECSGNYCSICKLIKEKSSGNWCFEWLRHLKDFEASQVLVEKDWQVHLMVDHTDNEVQHIRSRLAILQTQTVYLLVGSILIVPCGNDIRGFQPSWTLIDAINEQAKLKAISFAQIMQKESLINSRAEDTDLFQIRVTDKAKVDDNALEDIEKLMQRGKKKEKKLEMKKKNYSEFLKRYVASHIRVMLEKLYSKIAEEEANLRDIITKTGIATIKNFFDVSRAEFQYIEPEKIWCAGLYSTDLNPSIRVVGPVGERPLHVCALSANRFEQVDENLFGNYLSKGILQGMMDYIRSSDIGWNEAATQYGKDYCAAVGSFLLNDDKNAGVHLGKDPESIVPPFWGQILKWKAAHLRNGSSLCCVAAAPERIGRDLVSTGIYEGETIIFPLIAGKYGGIIQELFEKEAECREKRREQQLTHLSRYPALPNSPCNDPAS